MRAIISMFKKLLHLAPLCDGQLFTATLSVAIQSRYNLSFHVAGAGPS